MKKSVLFLVIALALVTSCSSHTVKKEDSNSNSEKTTQKNQNTVHTNEKEEKYKKSLEEAGLKQKKYIDTLNDSEKSTVQSISSAILMQSELLISQNPTDKEMITKLTQTLLKSNSETAPVPNSTTDSTKPTTDALIPTIMSKYMNKHNEVYDEATPATIKRYYEVHIPDEFTNVYIDNKQIKTQYFAMFMGQGELYNIKAFYVNKAESKLIVFAQYKDEKMVFVSNQEPVSGKIILEKAQDPILLEFK